MSPRWLGIGAPMDGSGTRRGERLAPDALRRAGLLTSLRAVDFGDLGLDITDSNRDHRTGVTAFSQVVQGSRQIRDCVSSAISAGWRPLVIGGCCSVLPGALAGARHQLGPFRLLFVDGHLDLFDGQTSTTGELAGMALAVVTGHGPVELTELGGRAPIVDAGDVVAVGDGDGARRRAFQAPGAAELIPAAQVIDAEAILRYGPEEVDARLGRTLGAGPVPFWLHLDIDVIDMGQRPASSFPVQTDLDWDQLTALLRPVANSPRIIGVSVTDLNTDLDEDDRVARRLTEALTALFRSEEPRR